MCDAFVTQGAQGMTRRTIFEQSVANSLNIKQPVINIVQEARGREKKLFPVRFPVCVSNANKRSYI